MIGKLTAISLAVIVLVLVQVWLSRKQATCKNGMPLAECASQLGSASEVFEPLEMRGSRVHVYKSTRIRGQDIAIVERDNIVIEVINVDSEDGKKLMRSLRN